MSNKHVFTDVNSTMSTVNMQNEMKEKRTDISILRILATLAVVFLHTNSGIIDRLDLFAVQGNQKIFLTLGKQYMNWAVPVFLMITGTLMLRKDKQITFYSCVTKYMKRILLALFFFGTPFSVMEIFMDRRTIDIRMLGEAMGNVVSGNSWGHLWYLYMLIGVYLILPILKCFADNAPRTELRNILIAMIAFQMIIPIIESVMGISVAFEIPFSTSAVLYLFLGKYLGDELPKVLKNKKLVVFCFVIVMVFAAYIYSFTYEESSLEYFAPVFAILIFSLIRNIDVPDKIGSMIWEIDRLCFGVYLIHPLFINFMYKFVKITPISFDCYWLMTGVFFFFFVVCSFLTSSLMSRIPVLRKYIL